MSAHLNLPCTGIVGALDAFCVAASVASSGQVSERTKSLQGLSLQDFVPALTPRWRAPRHLARLTELCERSTREPVFACISVPPRHAKTETILHAIVQWLIEEPGVPVCYASYAAKFAEGKSRLARDYVANAGLELRADARALNEWITLDGSSVCAVGRGGPMTGRGFRRIVVDDPFKNREEAESKLIRDRLYEWFTSTVMTRLEPGASVFVVHTRWNEDDLIGRLEGEAQKYVATAGEEGHPWEIISLPAVDEATGEALWPERYPVEALRRIRAIVGEYDWHSLYQQNPRPKGSRVFGVPARCERPNLDGARLVIGVDVAITASTRANWTVAVVLAVHGYGADMTADVVEVVRMQAELPEVCDRLEALQQTYGCELVVEAAGVGKAVPQTLRNTNPRLVIVEVYPAADKFTRAQPWASAWNTGRVRLRVNCDPDTAEFIRVHSQFTGIADKEDDDVDAASHAWNHALTWIEITGHVASAGDPEWT